MTASQRTYVSAPRAWVAMHPTVLAVATMLAATAATYLTRSTMVPEPLGPPGAPDIPAALIVPATMSAAVVFGATYVPRQLAATGCRRLLPYRVLWGTGLLLLGGLAVALAVRHANVGHAPVLRNYAAYSGLAFGAARLVGPGPAIVPTLVGVLACMALGWSASPTMHLMPWAFPLATTPQGSVSAGVLLIGGLVMHSVQFATARRAAT